MGGDFSQYHAEQARQKAFNDAMAVQQEQQRRQQAEQARYQETQRQMHAQIKAQQDEAFRRAAERRQAEARAVQSQPRQSYVAPSIARSSLVYSPKASSGVSTPQAEIGGNNAESGCGFIAAIFAGLINLIIIGSVAYGLLFLGCVLVDYYSQTIQAPVRTSIVFINHYRSHRYHYHRRHSLPVST